MNIFYLDHDPVIAAQMMCDKHIPKMIVEAGQMISTAHRMLDGTEGRKLSKSGKRTVKYYSHPDETLENVLYKAVHFNHPCTVWTMQSTANYRWHFEHFIALCNEYTYRYGKKHLTDTKMRRVLSKYPTNLPKKKLTPFALAMQHQPQCINRDDPVQSYKDYYITKQSNFNMVWSKREIPEWFLYNTDETKEVMYG